MAKRRGADGKRLDRRLWEWIEADCPPVKPGNEPGATLDEGFLSFTVWWLEGQMCREAGCHGPACLWAAVRDAVESGELTVADDIDHYPQRDPLVEFRCSGLCRTTPRRQEWREMMKGGRTG